LTTNGIGSTYQAMELKVKIWLSDDRGEGFLGEGRYRLLHAVSRCNSLQKAARQLGISYRKAWGDIQAVEKHLGFKMLIRRRGGTGGGNSILTEPAEKLLEIFRKIHTDLEKQARRHFKQRLKKLCSPSR